MTYAHRQLDALASSVIEHTTHYYRWPSCLDGATLLGQGQSKGVYRLSKSLVLKVKHPFDTLNQIENEIKVWMAAPAHIEAYLAEIYDFGPNWILAERLVPYYDVDSNKYPWASEAQWALFKLFASTSSPYYIGDYHSDNIGLRVSEEKACLLDYAGGASLPDWVEDHLR